MVDHDPIGYVDIQHTSCLNFNMPYYKWNYEKNERLKAGRGVCFEQVVLHIEQGDLLDVVEHPNKFKYPNQHVLIVKIESYVYLVPFVEDETYKFLKTIIPSRKATRYYLGV
jgi:hypothetical protein